MLDFAATHLPFSEICTHARVVVHYGAGADAYRALARARGAESITVNDRLPTNAFPPGAPIDVIHLYDVFADASDATIDDVIRAATTALADEGVLVIRERAGGTPKLERTYRAFSQLGLRIIGAGFEDAEQSAYYALGRRPSAPADPIASRRVPRSTDERTRVVFEGEFFTLQSSAIVNRELGLALSRLPQIDLSIRVVEPQSYLNAADAARFAALAQRRAGPNAGADVYIRQTWPAYLERPNARRYAAILPWEFGALPAAWIAPLRRNVDEVWCLSRYVRDVYLAAGFPEEVLAIVPCGIDPEVFTPDGPRAALPTQKGFKFLFVGGTIARKGIDILMAAYEMAFSRDDDVSLIVKDYGSRGGYTMMSFRGELERFAADPSKPELHVFDAELIDAHLAALYRACDAYVHPYRGEGFGLPVLEAMACGLPVVVTEGGSTDDFVDEAVGLQIRAVHRSIGSTAHGFELVAEGWEFDPKAEDVAAAMLLLYQNREGARALGRAAAVRARSKWTWANAARIAAARIDALSNAPI
ncbi:MAG: glycosyltransferase family 4 protein [Candidatus Eremiobacteraeota bacterium]|nr:glycosyltransferase family 4 protein [Candidatus Eremiobacteraeota bacterium]